MPLTPKGEKILKSMEETYGPEKAEQVLHASKNAGTITGIDATPRIDAETKHDPHTGQFTSGGGGAGPGGQFAKAHQLAGKHGFSYKGEEKFERGGSEHSRHVWEHPEKGHTLSLSKGGIGRGAGSQVATVKLGPNTERSESDPVWPENAVRRALKKAGYDAEQVLYPSKTGIDAMAGQPGPFGQANPFDDQTMAPPPPAIVDIGETIGADPGLPIPIFEHPQKHPGESTPPEPALPGGAADSTGAFYGGSEIRDVNGGITGGALRQDWGEGSTWPNVGDAMPASVGIADIQRQAEGFMEQWMPRELGPDVK